MAVKRISDLSVANGSMRVFNKDTISMSNIAAVSSALSTNIGSGKLHSLFETSFPVDTLNGISPSAEADFYNSRKLTYSQFLLSNIAPDVKSILNLTNALLTSDNKDIKISGILNNQYKFNGIRTTGLSADTSISVGSGGAFACPNISVNNIYPYTSNSTNVNVRGNLILPGSSTLLSAPAIKTSTISVNAIAPLNTSTKNIVISGNANVTGTLSVGNSATGKIIYDTANSKLRLSLNAGWTSSTANTNTLIATLGDITKGVNHAIENANATNTTDTTPGQIGDISFSFNSTCASDQILLDGRALKISAVTPTSVDTDIFLPCFTSSSSCPSGTDTSKLKTLLAQFNIISTVKEDLTITNFVKGYPNHVSYGTDPNAARNKWVLDRFFDECGSDTLITEDKLSIRFGITENTKSAIDAMLDKFSVKVGSTTFKGTELSVSTNSSSSGFGLCAAKWGSKYVPVIDIFNKSTRLSRATSDWSLSSVKGNANIRWFYASNTNSNIPHTNSRALIDRGAMVTLLAKHISNIVEGNTTAYLNCLKYTNGSTILNANHSGAVMIISFIYLFACELAKARNSSLPPILMKYCTGITTTDVGLGITSAGAAVINDYVTKWKNTHMFIPDFTDRSVWGVKKLTDINYVLGAIPNITGVAGTLDDNAVCTLTGAFQQIKDRVAGTNENEGGQPDPEVDFDASRCSSAYKNDIGDLVRPTSIGVYAKMKVK